MTLSLKEIYNRYSVRQFAREIEVKRLKNDGSYETNWNSVEKLSGLRIFDKSVGSINYSLSGDSYDFGIINIGNAKILLNSKNGQFDDENNSSSIFRNFKRHKSLLRIRDGYVDKYTDPNNPVDILETVFEGFIDSSSTSTKVDDDNLLQELQCIDLLSFLLKENTISDILPLSATTLNGLVYEIMNRPIFTEFFSVNAANISAGYNIANIDLSQYENQTQILNLLENLSLGHSYFFVKDGVFYYKQIDGENISDMVIDKKKIIKISNYNSGVENVVEKLIWEGEENIKYIATPNNYNKSRTIKIDGVTNQTEKQNILNRIGLVTRRQRRTFDIEIPYYPKVSILDKIVVNTPDIYPYDAFIWGISRWGDGSRWRKALRADNILNNEDWVITKITHNNYTTNLTLKEI